MSRMQPGLYLTHASRLSLLQELRLILYGYGWHKVGRTQNQNCLNLLVTQPLNLPFQRHLATNRNQPPRPERGLKTLMYVV